MAKFADLILDVRMQLPDELGRSVTDNVIFSRAIKAYRRINHTLFRNSLAIGKAYETITTAVGQAAYDLPADFLIDDGLYRGDGLPMTKIDDRKYQTLVSAPECSLFLLRGAKVYVATVPQSAQDLTLVYWPLLAISALTTSSTTPYDGKFDDVVVEYLVMSLAASDKTDNQSGAQFLQDMETAILETYAHLTPTMERQRGWNC